MANKNITSESSIERFFKDKCKALGMKCIKMIPTYEAGIPDRQVLYKGFAGFAELKRDGKVPTKLQSLYLEELKKSGFFTGVIDSKESAMKWIEDFQTFVDGKYSDIKANFTDKPAHGVPFFTFSKAENRKLPEVDKSKIDRYNR